MAVALIGSSQPCDAQEDADPTFHDQELVTAVDLMVGVELKGSSALKAWGRGLKLPTGLSLDQFDIRAGGKERTLVALDDIRDDRPVASEPWLQVIFIDVAGSRTRDIGMALEALSQRSQDLAELGSVQIVWRRWDEGVAKAVLETVMTPTRDGGELRKVLAKLALNVDGQDELTTIRYDLRRELFDQPWIDRAANRRIEKAWQAEVSKVIAHQDTLLTYLVDSGADAGARRAVYWVTSGFDLAAQEYYGIVREPGSKVSAGDTGTASVGDTLPNHRLPSNLGLAHLNRETTEFSRALAGYGWIVFPMTPPPPDPLRGKGSGVRLGKWRFLGLMANYEGQRLPDRAEAYLELGDAHRRGGKWQQASDAYDRAYFHFWGDPRTKSRQALALAGLGESLDHLNQATASRRAYEMAVALDPEVAEAIARQRVMDNAVTGLWAIRESGQADGMLSVDDRMRFVEGALKARMVPLRGIAEASSGRRVIDGRDLGKALDDLQLRLRLTLQLSGAPTGEVLGVDAILRNRAEHDDALRVSRWIRSGVPARLTRAVARRLLEEDRMSRGAGIEGVLRVEPQELVAGALRVELSPPPGVTPPRPIRVVVATGGPNHVSRSLDVLWSTGDSLPKLILDIHEPVLSIVWQDIETGAWGAERFPTGLD